MAGTGWERDNRTHFDEIVVNYDKIRWDYPDELFADVIQYSGYEKGKKRCVWRWRRPPPGVCGDGCAGAVAGAG